MALPKNKLPSRGRLNEAFRYCDATGRLYWRARRWEDFDCGKRDPRVVCKIWNAKYAGREALNSVNGKGYRHGQFDRKTRLAHRVIWKLVIGTEPNIIDHINGDTLDNRICNLRSVTHAVNSRNSRQPENSKNLYAGISKCHNRWRAQIGRDGARTHLGMFATFAEALAARQAAESSLGYLKRLTLDNEQKVGEGVE